jgi:hypothetical protein
MTMPEANEHSEQLEDSDFSLIYEDEDFDPEEPQIADEIEEPAKGKPKVKFQPSEESILCYGAPEDDEAIELLDRRYALEDEILLENGEKILLHLDEEQKLKREVIRNLSEARHNRKLFSEQLKEGAEKLNLSVR